MFYIFSTLTIKTHLTIDNPNPDIAPKRPATVWFMQRDAKSPTQLNTNATTRKLALHGITTRVATSMKNRHLKGSFFGTDGVFTLGETGQGSVTNTLCNTMWKLSHYILNGIGAGNYCPHCSGPSACLCLGPDSAQCDCNISARSVHIFLKHCSF